MPATKTTPNALEQLRVKNQYTVEEVSSIIDISSRQVLRWEQGISIPSTPSLFKLCVLYKTTLQELYPELCRRFAKKPTVEE